MNMNLTEIYVWLGCLAFVAFVLLGVLVSNLRRAGRMVGWLLQVTVVTRSWKHEQRGYVAELEARLATQTLAHAFIREQGLTLAWGAYIATPARQLTAWDELAAAEERVYSLHAQSW